MISSCRRQTNPEAPPPVIPTASRGQGDACDTSTGLTSPFFSLTNRRWSLPSVPAAAPRQSSPNPQTVVRSQDLHPVTSILRRGRNGDPAVRADERTRPLRSAPPPRRPLAAGHRCVRSAAPHLTVPHARRRLSSAALTRPACRGSPPRRRLAAAPAGPGPHAAVRGAALQSPQPRRARSLAAPPPPRPAPPARPPPAPPLPPPTGCRAHSVHREGGGSGDTSIAGAACNSASKCSAQHPQPSLRPLLIHSQKEKMAPDLPQEVTSELICMPYSQPIRRDSSRGSHWLPRRNGRGWGRGLSLRGVPWPRDSPEPL